MEFETLDDRIVRSLWPLRASAWHGYLSEAEYLERNEWLARKKFTQGITSYGLYDHGKLVTSLDVVTCRLVDKTDREWDAGHVASVITPPEYRGRGYSTALLKHVIELQPDRPMVLFSDVGPEYYARFGFRPFSASGRMAASSDEGEPLTPTSAENFLATMRTLRTRALDGKSLAVCPSADRIEWVTERFHHAAHAAQRALPRAIYFQAQHGGETHAAVAYPYFQAKRLEVAWATPGCKACLAGLSRTAHDSGLPTVRWWEDNVAPGEKEEWPMLRFPADPAMRFGDVQLIDYW